MAGHIASLVWVSLACEAASDGPRLRGDLLGLFPRRRRLYARRDQVHGGKRRENKRSLDPLHHRRLRGVRRFAGNSATWRDEPRSRRASREANPSLGTRCQSRDGMTGWWFAARERPLDDK